VDSGCILQGSGIALAALSVRGLHLATRHNSPLFVRALGLEARCWRLEC